MKYCKFKIFYLNVIHYHFLNFYKFHILLFVFLKTKINLQLVYLFEFRMIRNEKHYIKITKHKSINAKDLIN